KLNLLQLMNIPYIPNMQLKKINESTTLVIYNANPEQIYQQALQNLALVKAADLRSESAEKGVKAARGLLLPTLSLSGSLGTNYSSVASLSLASATADIATDNYVLINNEKVPVYAPQSSFSNQKIGYGDQWKNNFNSSISVNLSIPILNSLIARSRLNQAKILEKRTEFEASTTKIQLRQNIEQAYVNMTTAFERYQKLEEQVKDFTESFRAAEIRFNEGASTSVDYQIVKNNLDRAKINLIAAKYDYALRVQILDFYQGKL
ncbi:MAG: TolC family protein, partial [Parafilimonas sp.]